MDKKYAFLLSLMLVLLTASTIYLIRFANSHSYETVVVARVIDGDTLSLQDGRTVRLGNINTPEKNEPGSTLSYEYLKNFENKTVQMRATGVDKYQRVLAKLYAPNYLNLEIVKKGLAVKFLVDNSELKTFAEAEESAIKNSFGIWEKSPYSGCFESEIDSEDELIIIKNNCAPVNVNGWIIRDESRKKYILSNATLGRINLHSGKGINNQTDLFWNSATNIWNNDRDTLYILDSESKIVYYNCYGY